MAKPSRVPKTCIFCNGSQRSGEHIWPEWYSKVVPKAVTSHHGHQIRMNQIIREGERPIALAQPEMQKRPGDPASRKIRVVCKKCNETWMSGIEMAAAPVMTPLILGERTALSPQDQVAIVRWTVLKSMVAEFDDPPTAAISPEVHKQFKATLIPPETWKVWIGHYKGNEWRTRYRHTGMSVVQRSTAHTLVHPVKCNTQTSTFGAGELFIHAFSTSVPEAQAFTFGGATADVVHRIWPLTGETITWPIAPTMSDDDARYIADAFFMSTLARSAG